MVQGDGEEACSFKRPVIPERVCPGTLIRVPHCLRIVKMMVGGKLSQDVTYTGLKT